MSWKSLIDFIPTVVTQVGEVFRRKHEVKLKKIESTARVEEARAEAQINLLRDRQNADINWEHLSIQNSGWKDEYLTLFITTIVGLCFLPWTQDYVVIGFDTLSNNTPLWFQASFLVVIGSAFGVRTFDAFLAVITKRSTKKESQ